MAACNNSSISTENMTRCRNEHDHADDDALASLMPSFVKDATRAVYICTLLLGITGNVLVSFIIIRKPKPRKGIHIFTLNLSISDLVVLIVYLPLQMNLFESDMIWSLGDVFCKISYLIIPLSIYSSVGTLIAITYDRYMAIVHPLTNIRHGRTKRAILIIWLSSFVISMPLLLVSGVVDQGFCVEANWPSVNLERGYWIAMFLIQCVFPTLFFVVAYTVIILNLKQRSLPLEKSEYARMRMLLRKKQHQSVIKLAVALILVYLICTLPQHIVFFWVFYGDLLQRSFSMYAYLMANLLSIANSAINPVIYGTLNKEIKKGLGRIFRCRCRSDKNGIQTKSGRRQLKNGCEKSASLLSTRMASTSMKESPRQVKEAQERLIHGNNNEEVLTAPKLADNQEMTGNHKFDDVLKLNQTTVSSFQSSSNDLSDFEEPSFAVDNESLATEVTPCDENCIQEKVFHERIICRTVRRHGQNLFPNMARHFKKQAHVQFSKKKKVTFSSKEDRVTFIPLQTFKQNNEECEESVLLSHKDFSPYDVPNGSALD